MPSTQRITSNTIFQIEDESRLAVPDKAAESVEAAAEQAVLFASAVDRDFAVCNH